MSLTERQVTARSDINIVFRADASPKLATGHIMRCLTLAKALKREKPETNIYFICNQLPSSIKQRIVDQGHQLLTLACDVDQPSWHQDLDIEACKSVIEKIEHIELIIVDHYLLDIKWENAFVSYCEQLCVIDDLANRPHHADFLLDQTFNRDSQDYLPWLSPNCQLLLGQRYMLLRDEFVKHRSIAERKRQQYQKIKQILVNFGGIDQHNMSSQIIEILALFVRQKQDQQGEALTVNLIASSNFPHLKDIKTLAQTYCWLNLHIDCNNMAELMLDADIAIGANGSSAWERCCLGLPSLTVTLAENQQLIDQTLAHKGATISLGHYQKIEHQQVVTELNRLEQSTELYQNMVKSAFSCCDGTGAQQTAKTLLADKVTLHKAQPSDVDIIFTWQSNPKIRQFSRNPKPVTWPEHKVWFEKSLVNLNRHLYVVTHQESKVGVLRLDKMSEQKSYEVSILIAPEYQGKNIALRALHAIDKKFFNCAIHAYVSQQNKSSQRLFSKANYQRIADDYFVRPAYQKSPQNSCAINTKIKN